MPGRYHGDLARDAVQRFHAHARGSMGGLRRGACAGAAGSRLGGRGDAHLAAALGALLATVAARSDSREQVARAGGAEQIMRAMYRHGDDGRVQQVGCSALRALSGGGGGGGGDRHGGGDTSEYDTRTCLRDAVVYAGDSAVQVHQLLLAAKANFAPQCKDNVNATMRNLGIAADLAASASFATLASPSKVAQPGRPQTAGTASPKKRRGRA